MSTFELQIFKSGNWSVDSYFDDRDLAMSEAEKIDGSGRHAGVRILQEDYDEPTNKSNCRVIFSKMRQTAENQEWRVQAQRAARRRTAGEQGDHDGELRIRRRRPASKKSNTSLYIALAVAFVLLIAGAAAMIGLQEFAKFL